MKILNIEKKDVWVTMEFSAEHLDMLKMIFDHATIEFDKEKEPEMEEANAYLQEHFYPFLKYFSEQGRHIAG